MIIDTFHRLCGTQSDPAVAPTGQSLASLTTGGAGSANVIDVFDKIHVGDGQDLYLNMSFPIALASATANATISAYVVAQPVSSATGALSGTYTFTTAYATQGNVITSASAHGLSIGSRVTVASSATLPSGLSASTNYYVCRVVSDTKFTLSATPYGSEISITTDGTGTHTATWYSEIVGAVVNVPLQRLAPAGNTAICINSAAYGYLPYRYLSAWFVPSHNLTAGSVVADLVWDQQNLKRDYPCGFVVG